MSRPDLDPMPVRVVEPSGHAPARVRTDLAVRILEFDSPRRSDGPLSMHTGFSVLSGLSRQALAAVVTTVDAVHDQTPEVGLGGTIVADGTVHGMHARLPLPVDHSYPLADDTLDIGFTDPARLAELVEAIEAALLLAEAELRGANESRRILLREELDVPEVIDLRTPRSDIAEIRETLAALDAIVPSEQVIAQLRTSLTEFDGVGERIAESTLVEQLETELASLPTGSDDERVRLESALDEAVEARNRLDRERTAVAYRIVDVLGGLGIKTDHDDAPAVARRVIDEQADLEQIRARLLAKLDEPKPHPRIHEPSPELAAIEARLVKIRRRQQTQRQLLHAANEALAVADGRARADVPLGPMRDEVRPLPMLLVEPLADLPPDLGSEVLSILMRVSEMHQVICLSESEAVHGWADDVGGRVGHIEATGWFAGVPA